MGVVGVLGEEGLCEDGIEEVGAFGGGVRIGHAEV